MPIVMTIVACAVMVVMQMMSSDLFANKTNSYQRERTIAEKKEAIRLAGPLVRDAFELYQRAAGACPPGTIRKRTSTGQNLCWRNSTEDGQCIRLIRAKNPLWACPAETSTNNLAFLRLLMNEAQAVEVVVTPIDPVSGGGVHLYRSTCGPLNPCPRCSDTANTTCVTMRFCVSETPNRFNCPAGERVAQTFVFRR